MALTKDQQHQMVRYVKAVGDHLGDLSPERRAQAMASLDKRLQHDLGRVGGDDPEGVVKVLRRYGTPSAQAARLLGEGRRAPNMFLEWPDRVWLGVCGGLARKMSVEPGPIRLVFILLGLVPPLTPLLLLGYLITYFAVYFSADHDLPRIRPARLAKAVLTTAGIIAALHIGARLLLLLVTRAYHQFLGEELSLYGRWGGLLTHGDTWFIWAVLILIPLSILYALPVREAWSGTLKKIVQAGLALYAVALCYGIACVLVGVALAIVDAMGGTSGMDALINAFG
jgi:phage shock protein PspC (stress-responsive transcriptional regulator)